MSVSKTYGTGFWMAAGYREDQQDNAIYSAKTPVMDALWAKRPHTLIDASGLEVGLPDRQMGNPK
jgi:2,3-bisphosphoglycerate-independent phosphoglycerate mutase